MPFKSKAQMRFAYATKQPWAARWSDETKDAGNLPERKALANLAKKKGRKAKKGMSK